MDPHIAPEAERETARSWQGLSLGSRQLADRSEVPYSGRYGGRSHAADMGALEGRSRSVLDIPFSDGPRPFVIFPGNVRDEDTMIRIVTRLVERSVSPHRRACPTMRQPSGAAVRSFGPVVVEVAGDSAVGLQRRTRSNSGRRRACGKTSEKRASAMSVPTRTSSPSAGRGTWASGFPRIVPAASTATTLHCVRR